MEKHGGVFMAITYWRYGEMWRSIYGDLVLEFVKGVVMETGILIFRQVVVTIVVAENDTHIRLQIERSNPAILAPQLLWLSSHGPS